MAISFRAVALPALSSSAGSFSFFNDLRAVRRKVAASCEVYPGIGPLGRRNLCRLDAIAPLPVVEVSAAKRALSK